ncbi:MAG: redoxin domain-containing protein [Alphaproteobacteria bacterium]
MIKQLATLGAIALFAMPITAQAAPEIGQPAPEITATDTAGNPFKLSDHKGDIVVLEWTNHACPFVKKHYGSNNMQNTQKTAHEKGVKWVSIVSSAKGNQGHVTAEEANTITTEQGATITAKILDESGEIGKLYDAKTTPHIYIVDKDGILAYQGAIDSKPSPNPKTIEGAENYALSAINDLTAGKPVRTPQTAPYGCSVKYAH